MDIRRQAPEPYLTELSAGVFAYVQPDGGWCLSNSGILAGHRDTVVVDTGATVSRALRLKEAVAKVNQAEPVTIVNTHHHGDHFFGNCAFGTAGAIIAHHLAREEMAEAGLGLQELWPHVDWGEVVLTLPTLTFTDRLTIRSGNLTAELIHVGPAHTTNDIVVWLPDSRVLFAGDVIFNGITPFTLMGSVVGSLAAVERVRDLGPEVIVPGHGAVGGPELLDETAAYLTWITDLAAAGFRAGLAPLELARKTDLGQYAELIDNERIVGNLIRAYAELRGEAPGAPLDVLAGFRQIVDYHGGLPACLALPGYLASIRRALVPLAVSVRRCLGLIRRRPGQFELADVFDVPGLEGPAPVEKRRDKVQLRCRVLRDHGQGPLEHWPVQLRADVLGQRGEADQHPAPVTGVPDPLHQSPRGQPVHHRGHGVRGNPAGSGQGSRGHGSFLEHVQAAAVGPVDAELLECGVIEKVGLQAGCPPGPDEPGDYLITALA
jgi:cyclase